MKIQKYILGVLLILLAFSNVSQADHLIGGDVEYKFIKRIGDSVQYSITLKIYANDEQQARIPDDDGNVVVGVYESAPGNEFGKNLYRALTLFYVENPVVTVDGPVGCNFKFAGYTIMKWVFSNTITLPANAEGYHIVYANCCRIRDTENFDVENSVERGETFYGYIPPTDVVNNSATFSKVPLPFLCFGDTLTSNNFAIDADGDSLVYSLVTPYSDAYGQGTPKAPPSSFINWPINTIDYNVGGGYDINNMLGPAPNGYASIDPFTGIAQYKPDKAKFYALAIEIKEYRKGKLVGIVRRDVEIFARTCTQQQQPPDYSTTSGTASEFHIRAGQALCFPITFSYPEDSLVFLEVSGDLFTNPNIPNKPTLTGPTQGIRTVTQNFCWDTECTQARTVPYTFAVTGNVGCPAQSLVVGFKIFVDSVQPKIMGSQLVCPFVKNVIYTVSDTSNSTFSWSVTGGTMIELADTAISVNWNTLVPGKVFCTENTTDGCTGTRTFIANIDRSLQVHANAPSIGICSGDTISLGPLVAAPTGTFVWRAKGSAPLSTLSRVDTSNIKFVYENTGTADIILEYYFETFADDGCYSIDTASITVHPRPVVALSSNMPIQGLCAGDAVKLKAQKAGFTTGSVVWTDVKIGSTVGAGDSIVIIPSSSTTYLAKITDANSCTNTFTIQIKVNPLPSVSIFNPGKDTVCSGTPVSLIGFNAETYKWTDVGNPVDTLTGGSVVVTPTITTDYRVTGTDVNGCKNTYVSRVNVLPLPDVLTGTPQITICPGINNTISVTSTHNIVNYEWKQLDSAVVLSSTANIIVSPTANATYVAKLTDSKGCVNTRNILVNVYPAPAPSGIDAITPSVCPGYIGAIYKVIGGLPNSNYFWILKGGSITPGTPISVDSLSVNWDNKEDTLAYVKVIETSEHGCVGDTVTLAIRVELQLHPPAPTGIDTLCSKDADNILYSIEPLPGSNYTWIVDGGAIVTEGGIGNSNVVINWDKTKGVTHTISFREDNGPCYGFSPKLNIVVYPSPTANAILGAKTACSKGKATYAIDGLSGSSFTWKLAKTSRGSLASDNNTISIEVQWPEAFMAPIIDTISVLEISDKGCVGDSIGLIVIINPPHKPDEIRGSDFVCIDPDNIAVTPVYSYVQYNGLPGSTYKWSIDGNGASIVRTNNDSAYVKFTDLSLNNTVQLTLVETTADSCEGIPIFKKINFDYTKPYIQAAGTSVKDARRISVRWDSSFSANGSEKQYVLYRRVLYSNDSWTNLGTVFSNVYIDNDVNTSTFGYEYKYEVQNKCGDISSSRYQNTILLKNQPNEKKNSIELSWNTYHNWDGGVLQYELWGSFDDERDYTLMKTFSISDSSVVLENGGDAFIHRYRIRAVQNTSALVRESWSNEATIEFVHSVSIPSVITPNSDGANDVWKIANLSSYKNASIEVFNRWGDVVYKFIGTYQNTWDGTSSGKDLPDGTYFYIIKLNAIGTKANTFQGNITIVR